MGMGSHGSLRKSQSTREANYKAAKPWRIRSLHCEQLEAREMLSARALTADGPTPRIVINDNDGAAKAIQLGDQHPSVVAL